ncbi:MAG: phosphoribosylformylglycinamidine synthase subunit PurQ [Deltaproteobacteria bacterium]|nr:MAG: phosphoribosylformylglycinamidine synthase subunit PurQ [Deltaproteobacteria bacterium]
MASVRVLVVSGNGTNCERETAYACELAGADRVDIVPIWNLAAGDVRVADYNFLCLPGGFMDGDDLGAARAAAVRWRHAIAGASGSRLFDDLCDLISRGGLVLGICNGFQLMVKLGLLPRLEPGDFSQKVTLTFNDSGRFEDRWVRLGVDPRSPCVFTKGLEMLELPVRHGEGKLAAPAGTIDEIENRRCVPVRYIHPDTAEPTMQYPHNPNGSPGAIAGLCDPSGRLFGLMPHPECFLHRTHHPRWTRRDDMPEQGEGLRLFRNGVEFLRSC